MSFKHRSIFNEITDTENMYKAYKKTQEASLKYKHRSLIFDQNRTQNLKALRESLLDGTYQPGKYIRFTVYEPKERIIDAPDFKDKIVQHMLVNVIGEIYRKCFIHDSYSCIKNKGTHKAVLRIDDFLKHATKHMDNPWVVRIDIKKFFYSVDRDILKPLFRKKITCPQTLALIDVIIDSSPGLKGLPLGCTTSQLFTNIYMNELDNYIKRRLRVKYYVRYSDDAVIFTEGKKQAVEVLDKIKVFVESRLNLLLNPNKSMVSKASQGVNMTGFYITSTQRKLRRSSKKRVKRKLKKMPALILSGRMTEGKAEQMLNSWLGHARYANTGNFISYLMNRFSILKKNTNQSFKIKIKQNETRTKKKTKHGSTA